MDKSLPSIVGLLKEGALLSNASTKKEQQTYSGDFPSRFQRHRRQSAERHKDRNNARSCACNQKHKPAACCRWI